MRKEAEKQGFCGCVGPRPPHRASARGNRQSFNTHWQWSGPWSHSAFKQLLKLFRHNQRLGILQHREEKHAAKTGQTMLVGQ